MDLPRLSSDQFILEDDSAGLLQREPKLPPVDGVCRYPAFSPVWTLRSGNLTLCFDLAVKVRNRILWGISAGLLRKNHDGAHRQHGSGQ